MRFKVSIAASRPIFHAILGCMALATVTFLVKLYSARRRFVKLQRQGLPMPPHSLLFGHLLTFMGIMRKLPGDVHGHCLPGQIRCAMPELGPIFYLDNWPFGPPILVVASPSAAYQITQERSLPKSDVVRRFLRPLTGGNDLVTMEGEIWKIWRRIFSPGFSAGHLITLVPEVMKDTLIFCDILREHVQKGDVFQLDDATTNMTVDVIGRVTLDTHLNAQRTENELTSALRNQIRWLSSGMETNPFHWYHPLRPLVQWYNTRRMNRYISRELENRFTKHQSADQVGAAKRSKSIVDLALDIYLGEQTTNKTTKGMDKTFKKFAITQIKTFIFAGHDTTSSTLCYIFHLLSKTPSALHRLRAEHDNVFGSDLTQTAQLITRKPHLLNELPYTLAVIKESLRLFPPGSSPRKGERGFFVTDSDGRQYPTEGFMLWSLSQAIHRDPTYWPQPDSFLPERWLVSMGDPLYPTKGAWRPFELGPRNCLGQELATLEMRIIMAMTVRQFDIRAAYEEWDALNPRRGPKTVDGERAYQVLVGSAHPSDRFPCRVKLARE